jgi:hypothetical protein
LTSQIFANIYLAEFDRYVRHTLKPLGYLRYGDDFIIIIRDRQQARVMRERAEQFLVSELQLHLHPQNNVIVPARSGLHFLGHVITGSYTLVDRHTTRLVLEKSSARSIASYKALHLATFPKKELDWQLLDDLEDLGLV